MKMLLPVLLSVFVMVSASDDGTLADRCENCKLLCGPITNTIGDQLIARVGGKRADTLALASALRYYVGRYGRENIQRLLNNDFIDGDSYKYGK